MAQAEVYIPWEGWRLVRLIGQGSFGRVYEIEKRTGRNVQKASMKVISISTEMLDDVYGSQYDEGTARKLCENALNGIRKEYEFMKELRGNPNIVRCDDMREIWHQDGIGCDVFIMMELLTPLNAIWKSDSITEDDVIALGRDICRALIACEQHTIIHRDIKPQNILVNDKGVYKLGDFGTAKVFERTSSATKAGTEIYMAPEVIKREKYGRDVDTYSLGLVMYRMLNKGQLPFIPVGVIPTAEQRTESLQRRISGETPPPPADGSPAIKAIVLKACSFNRIDRYSYASEMLEDLDMVSEETVPMFHSNGPGKKQRRFVKEPEQINITLTAEEAIRGCHRSVTIGNKIYTIEIPANTATGDRFEIRSQTGELTGIANIVGIVREQPEPPGKGLSPQAPSGKNLKVIIAAIAAVVVLAAAGAIALLHGGDQKPADTPDEPEAVTQEAVQEDSPADEVASEPETVPEQEEAPQITADPVNMGHIKYVSASSQLDTDKKGFTYFPENMVDNDLSTGWVEGVSGNGEGEVAHIVFDDVYKVSGFMINSGYQKSQDIYKANSRPSLITLEFSDGTSMDFNLKDEMNAQQFTFPESVDTDYVDITIRAVYTGSKWEDTVISEIRFY